jgi:predicted ATPase
MATEPTLLANRFELGEWIGEGSLSVVHEAIDRATGRRVAIKLATNRSMDGYEAARRSFEREAAALSVISSAHVVELISAGTATGGRPFLVLERLTGKNLQDMVSAGGPLSAGRVARVVAEAAAALELAHGVGIVHRDLKPANLFLHDRGDGQPIVKVLDFGMVVDTAGPTDRMRDAFGGTPFYMAPEQVRGQLSRIGAATDIWAVAFVTLTLLTGEIYWTASSANDVMREIEASALDRPSLRWTWLPEAFDQWFLRSTRRVPERRFRSIATQATQLAEALRGVRAPDRAASVSSLVAANTMAAARTPTPSIIRLSGHRMPVIGRQLDHREVDQLLAPGSVVTLTGTAGIGKTRLAQAVCDGAGDRFIDGAWFVPLTTGEGDQPVESAIAAALGLEPDATRSIGEHVVTSLAPRRVLIVLDGAEHVTGCAEVIDRLRRRCPAVGWLVTSRLPLGLADERCHGVEPLEVPRTTALTAGEAETFSAVELFVRSAREGRPSWELDDANVADVVAICRAVEGFPLGIELAAARIQASTPAQIRAALEDDAPASTGAQPSSVRHAVAWSYGLLAPDQQRMLRHLAVLPAGLTFDQVKRRLAHLSDDPMYAVLRLVQTHLVAWTSDPPRRLVMLDTVRELCRDLSHEAGEDAALWRVAREHAEAIAAEGATSAVAPETWLALVDAEHDNLRSVLAHLLVAAPADAMRLAGQLAYYWYLRGEYLEGTRWLEASIERSPVTAGESLARALHGAGRLALLTCRYERAAELLERARTIARSADDDRGEANADQLLGSVARERGDYARAHAYHRRSLELWNRIGDRREAARARNYLVFAAWLGAPLGDPGDEQRAWWEGAGEAELDLLGDPEASVWFLLNRGAILHYANDPAAARVALGHAFAEAISARFHEGIAWALDLLGKTAFDRGEHLQARAQLAASLRVHRRLGDRWRCASVLEALAAVAVASERPARGAVYLGAAAAIRDQIETPVPACERALLARTERRGVELIGEAFHAGRERGRRAPLDQTVELARDVA